MDWSSFPGADHGWCYFHNAKFNRKDLADYTGIPKHVEIVSPQHLAVLAMDAGLVGWIEHKVA